ncbi:MerR family transcriptional regulator [Paenibacillus ehimensis]|uniref:MerR family transcriptional regulator n=1 Tax=Paenibacillus ehimensis TaxID=79264 RepID=A0ABT8V6W8_9BACL|nr:MerR family transcriptional regulator [Paenibacillus ehimensis]MDO3677171.1 MerR family transcriptional regulator [Paenibacillus ehimensis]MEC0212927.1 MerR family transcriptional regulator [Paenibacillus ehimensis]
MKISQLSRATGASPRSIRHYEKKKLLTANRLENDYREFDESAVERVKAIQIYLRLGLSTEEIEQVLNCKDNYPEYEADEYCDEMLAVYEEKLNEINKQMSTLATVQQRLEKQIRQMKARGTATTAGVEPPGTL